MPLLIIDGLGMRKLGHTAAEDLLELSIRRYERPSTLLPRIVRSMIGENCSATRRPSPRSSIGYSITRTCSNAGHGAGGRRCRPICAQRTERSKTHGSRPPEIAGLALSINCRFSTVHRGKPQPNRDQHDPEHRRERPGDSVDAVAALKSSDQVAVLSRGQALHHDAQCTNAAPSQIDAGVPAGGGPNAPPIAPAASSRMIKRSRATRKPTP